jgi:hypothetical protein
MRERGGWLDPVDVEAERVEERRRGCEWMDRRANVVAEAGKRQLLGTRSSADRLAGLENEDRASGLGESDGGGEPVRPGADDDGV